MRFIALAIILASLPVLISLLRQHPQRRPWALTAIGFMLFLGGELRVDAALIGWPLWNGIARGMEVSLVDTLGLALIITRRGPKTSLPFLGLLGFYGAALILSMVISAVPMASLFVCWQFGRVVLLFVAIGGECDRENMRRALLTGVAAGLLLQAGYVAQQKLSGVVQASGTMYHQNVLGLMTELALMPLLAALLGGDRRKLVVAGIVAALIIVTGGGSRGAMAIAGGGLVVLMLLSLARGVTPVKAKVVGLACLGLAIAAPLAMMTLKDRFGSGSMTVQDDQRPAFERAARAMSADHPFGVGANLYVSTANTKGYADRAGVAWNFSNRSAPVHNAYLLARAEAGWLAEIALILMLAVPLMKGLQFAYGKRRLPGGEVALGSAVAVGVNVVHNNFEFATLTYSVLTLLILNFALIAGQVRAARQAGRQRPAPGGVQRPGASGPAWAVAKQQPR